MIYGVKRPIRVGVARPIVAVKKWVSKQNQKKEKGKGNKMGENKTKRIIEGRENRERTDKNKPNKVGRCQDW